MSSTIRCAIWQTLNLGQEFQAIIRCPEFQRLRSLKQLGFVFSLYPGAIHSRYEHSLGTAHLCRVLLDALEKNSNVSISPFHRKCVIVAGLLHDVGHGPFSHAWERISKGRHEEMSVRLVETILGYRVPDFFAPLEREVGIDLVQSLISGDTSLLADNYKYLAEIVSNKYCEIDVDKWDYICRDLFYLRDVEGVPKLNADSFGFFQRAQITNDADGVSHIAHRLEDLPQVRAFFKTRRELRKRVYLHPRVEESEIGFCDLVKKASRSGFLFNGRSVDEATEDIAEFILLNDSIMNHLEIWMANHRADLPELYKEYEAFKGHINQFTDYQNISDTEEQIQMKSPLFFSETTGEVQRIAIPY